MENIDLYSQKALVQNSWSMESSALLIEVKRGNKLFTSSAVAIGDDMLITAAHAVDQYESAKVLLGDDYAESYHEIKIKRCIIHPGYKPSKSFYENDIAIILLEKPLPAHIKRESIAVTQKLTTGDVLERVGFGMRQEGNVRHYAYPLFKGQTFNQKNFILEDANSVLGDSGGPIYLTGNNQTKLLGIHSTLEGTDKTYIVNLGYYINWIEMNLSGTTYSASSIQR